MSYTKKRYITYILISAFIMVVPFITIDGNHLLLLSFEKLQFHFMGFAFNVDELFIMELEENIEELKRAVILEDEELSEELEEELLELLYNIEVVE